jgi:hypothetical protein
MNAGLINRLINLVRRTGHRVVFGDPETGEAVVVMDLAEYEQLIGTGEDGGAPEAYDQVINQDRQRPINRQQHQLKTDRQQTYRNETSIAETEAKKSDVVRGKTAGSAETGSASRANNLTTPPTEAIINRDIDGQKANLVKQPKSPAPEVRHQAGSMNQPSVHSPASAVQSAEPDTGLDDEERFYLEPLE